MPNKQSERDPSTDIEVVEELIPTVEAEDGVEFEEIIADLGVVSGEEEPPVRKQPKKQEKEEGTDEDDIPEQLRGKSAKELARMLRESQSMIGRQAQELGDLRKTHDDVIRTTLARMKQEDKPVVKEEKPVEEVDFFGDPKTAVERIIAQHPALKELSEEAKRQAAFQIAETRRRASEQFHKNHPDSGEIINDPEFRAWVEKSPVRKSMLLRTHRNYDVAAGDELFGTWKELKSLRAQKKEEEDKTTPKQVRKPAKVPTGGNANPKEQGGGKSQKIYRRSQVVRLMETDPERYASMADEITKAYEEGRVR